MQYHLRCRNCDFDGTVAAESLGAVSKFVETADRHPEDHAIMMVREGEPWPVDPGGDTSHTPPPTVSTCSRTLF